MDLGLIGPTCPYCGRDKDHALTSECALRRLLAARPPLSMPLDFRTALDELRVLAET